MSFSFQAAYVFSNQGGFTKEEEENGLWGIQFTVSVIDNETHLGWLVNIYGELKLFTSSPATSFY